MPGHAHDEITNELTISDIIVLIGVVLLLFISGLCLLRLLRNQCVKYIRKEIQKEVKPNEIGKQRVVPI